MCLSRAAIAASKTNDYLVTELRMPKGFDVTASLTCGAFVLSGCPPPEHSAVSVGVVHGDRRRWGNAG